MLEESMHGGPAVSGLGRVLVTGGGGAIGSNVCDELVLAGADEIVVLDNFVRGRRANLDWARANGNVRLVEGDIRDRELVYRPQRGHRPRLPPRRDPHHAVRGGAAPGARGPRRRHLQRLRGGGRAGRAPRRGLLVGVGLRARGGVPHAREPPPVRERHALRRGQGVQRGPAAQHPRDVRARLRRAALLQRLRAAHGRPRPLHRGARPLDGAHHRRQAAADPRRRPRRRWTSSTWATSRARTCSPPPPTSPTSSSTSPAGPRRACSSWPRCC